MSITPYFVKVTFTAPTEGQPLTAGDFPFTVSGIAVPQPPATFVFLGAQDVDDGDVGLLALSLTGAFSFQIADPGTPGPHLVTVLFFDDTGELTATSVSFVRA